MYRKPNGEYTEDAEEMTAAWMELAAPIEKATGWVMYAFCPSLAFTKSGVTATLPVKFARALSSALRKEE